MVFTDPEAYQPMMKFFDIAAPWVSQDAPGLKEASLTFFKQNVLKSALAKLFFFVVRWCICKHRCRVEIDQTVSGRR